MKTRKQEQVDAFKQRILQCAKDIIQEEGMQALSMRKISNRLSYTQGILYHYFENKDAILTALTFQGYQEILTIIKQAGSDDMRCDQRLAVTLKSYMEAMLARGDIFLIMMLSDNPSIYGHVNLLQHGIRSERASIDQLCTLIEVGIQQTIFQCEDVELRAQSIWCATFGMILRLYKENIQGLQRERLIQEHIHMMIQSMELR